MGSYNVLILCC